MTFGTTKADVGELHALSRELRATSAALHELNGRAASAVVMPPGPGTGEALMAVARFRSATQFRAREIDALARSVDVTARLFELFNRPAKPPSRLPMLPVLPPGFLKALLHGIKDQQPATQPPSTAAPAPSALGDRIVSVAQGQVGTHEEGDDTGQQIEKYQHFTGSPPGTMWCASFVAWTLDQAGVPLGPGSWAGVKAYVAAARAGGGHLQLIDPAKEPPRAGDLVVTNWSTTPENWGHIGIVTSFDAQRQTFTGIDGNWGDDGSASVANSSQKVGDHPRLFIRVVP